MKGHQDNKKNIQNVVQVLTRERFSHSYIISRREAKETLGLNVIEPDTDLTQVIIDLFSCYSDIMELESPYNPEPLLANANKDTDAFVFNQALIESINITHVYRTTKEIKRISAQIPNQPIPVIAYQERILQQGWVDDKIL